MKVFLSHALIDKKLANHLKQLLSSTSLGLIDPWLSSSLDGLKPGDVLWNEIHEQLSSADRILTLLTPNSYHRPWLLYESGYVAGLKNTRVVPVCYGIDKSNLPSPLSAYVVYSVDDSEELKKLLHQLISEVVPIPNRELIENQASHFCQEAPQLLNQDTSIQSESESTHLDALNVRFIDKLKASEILHRKLADETTKRITIITYTNEVEAGALNHYRVKGNKEIEIFKRSMLFDLAEQQSVNVKRVASDSKAILWNKFKVSIQATKSVEQEFPQKDLEGSNVKITQYFYNMPPTRRAYIFDEKEAIIAFYELVDDFLHTDGSIYKGMNKLKSLLVSNESEIGRQLITELINYRKILLTASHSLEEETAALKGHALATSSFKLPCYPIKAVFLDMDGVLYDSLPNYVKAWQGGFQAMGMEFPEIEVYRHEGRPSRDTVETFLRQTKVDELNASDVEKIIEEKNRILTQLNPPPIQSNALEMVGKIKRSGFPMWVVTGSTQPNIKDRIVADFDGMIPFNNIVTGADYNTGKPSPVPYRVAAQRARIEMYQSIVIENAPLGVQSAARGGAFCIAINTGILDDREIEAAGAKLILSGCKELENKWEEIVSCIQVI